LHKIEILFHKQPKATKATKATKKMVYIEIDGVEWMQCDHCGNIWDGYSQCDCWALIDIYDSDDEEAESGYESN
jgi:hypothetical protein